MKMRNPPPASWIASSRTGWEISEMPENAAVMRRALAVAMPTHTPVALRHPLVMAVRAMRKKSTPGISSARKCAIATAMN